MQTLKDSDRTILLRPFRREKVEFARVFQVFGEREGIHLQAKRSTSSANRRWWLTTLSAFIGPRPVLQWGLAAAALVLLSVGGWLVVDNLRLRQQMSQTTARRDVLMQREQDLQKELEGQRAVNSQVEQELARVRNERERLEQELKKAQPGGVKTSSGEGSIVSLILAPPLRGAGPVATLSIRPETNQVATQLQLETADYPACRVALIDPIKSQTLWRSGNLKPGTKGVRRVIVFSFNADLLKQQHYVLRVSGLTATGSSEVVGDYSFKVVK